MNRWRTLLDQITVEITSADCTAILNALTDNDIRLHDIKYCDSLTFRTTVSRYDQRTLLRVAEKYGAYVKFVGAAGIYLTAYALVKRPVLLTFIMLVFFIACFLPGRILFISVDGNASVPDKFILEAAAECGISFGAKSREVRSEIMKNKLLERIPQLQWAGINTAGCTAVISVREKTAQEKQQESKNQVSSIVAARDGIIQSCTITQGNPLCAVGQAVKAGQTLVSGYLDCGIITKTTQADAEIRALTSRKMEVVAPAAAAAKGSCIKVKTNYSLRIGKNLIKFYKDSGNLDVTCGKIYLEEYIHLPGGFALPIAVVKETVYYYGGSDVPADADAAEWVTDFAREHLEKSMISGEIISCETTLKHSADACYLYGKYSCLEMIGQVKYEQTLTKDERDD